MDDRVVTGLLSIAGIFVLRADARHLFGGLLGRALPIVILSVPANLTALILLRRATARWSGRWRSPRSW